MTNILAFIAISLVTNVSERLPEHQVSGPYPPGTETLAVYRFHMEPDANPTVKWVRTTVIEKTMLNFNLGGVHYQTNGVIGYRSIGGKDFSELLSERTLSDIEVEHHLNQTWSPSGTNDVKGKELWSGQWQPRVEWGTNLTFTNGVIGIRLTNQEVIGKSVSIGREK